MNTRPPITAILKRASMLVAAVAIAELAATAHPAAAEETVEVIGHSQPEAVYVDDVHDRLARAAHFPTGREASLTQPEGIATVWFVLARDGHVVARGLEHSSTSTLLDNQAQHLVGRGRYDALPAAAWVGETTHRFVATYRFVREPMSAAEAGIAQVAVR